MTDTADQAADEKSSSHPLLFDHYRIEGVLGEGSMGSVYLARDMRIGRRAALKTLRKPDEEQGPADSLSEEFLARFKREAEVCGSLHHPNIVTLYEVGYSNREIKYLAMEYVEGESLLGLLRREGAMSVQRGATIALDILRGLAYAHERGIVHRDVKPANILVTTEGNAKIADFGVARTAREGVSYATKAGQLLGTPYYMSPEAVAGKDVDERSDLFSVGALLYEVWSGKRPFEGESVMDVLYDVVNRDPEPVTTVRADLPAWCDRFLSRLMAKAPAKRFLSARAAANELDRLLALERQTSGFGDVDTPQYDMTAIIDGEDVPTHRLESNGLNWTRLKIQRVPSEVAYGIILVLLALLVLLPVFLSEDSEEVGPVMPPELARELEEKTRMLERARVLEEAEAWQMSLAAYQEILDLYPDTPSAVEGRQRVQAEIEDRLLDDLEPLEDE